MHERLHQRGRSIKRLLTGKLQERTVNFAAPAYVVNATEATHAIQACWAFLVSTLAPQIFWTAVYYLGESFRLCYVQYGRTFRKSSEVNKSLWKPKAGNFFGNSSGGTLRLLGRSLKEYFVFLFSRHTSKAEKIPDRKVRRAEFLIKGSNEISHGNQTAHSGQKSAYKKQIFSFCVLLD